MSAAVLPFSPAQVAIVEAAAVPFYRTPAGMAKAGRSITP